MDYVITLIAAQDGQLSQDDIDAVIEEVAPFYHGEKVVLAEKTALDIFLDVDGVGHLDLPDLKGVDIIYQHADKRRKKLLLADMDSTIVQEESLDEIAAYVGIHHEISEITEKAMNGELDFKEALEARVKMLKGLSEIHIQDVASRVNLTPGAKILLDTMKHYHARCVLVTGGFEQIVQPISQNLGFDDFFCNRFVVENGALTGQVIEPIFDKNSKRQILEYEMENYKLSEEETMAIGDGANDIPMLKSAGLGVGFHAKPAVRREVQNNIKYGDLTALLYAQGYHNVEFITG